MYTTYNYYDNTKTIFKGCKTPKRNADYISYSSRQKDIVIPFNEIQKYLLKLQDPKTKETYYTLNTKGIYYVESKYGNTEEFTRKIHLNKTKSYCTIAGFPISSKYWHGKNSKGSFIIRQSNHWSYITNFNGDYEYGCGKVASCFWTLKTNNNEDTTNTGKSYLQSFKPNNKI